MKLNTIKEQAEFELEIERRRKLIDKEKEKIKATKWWHKLWPFQVTITRRK